MTKNERKGPRKPAVKFAHLRKKMQQSKSQQARKSAWPLHDKPPGTRG